MQPWCLYRSGSFSSYEIEKGNLMFSSKNCNFFHFNFLHQGLCQSIICHRFSILGSLMLEESSATLHRRKSELSSAIENMNFPVQKNELSSAATWSQCSILHCSCLFQWFLKQSFFMHLCLCCLVTVFGKFFVSLFIFFSTMCFLCLYFVRHFVQQWACAPVQFAVCSALKTLLREFHDLLPHPLSPHCPSALIQPRLEQSCQEKWNIFWTESFWDGKMWY